MTTLDALLDDIRARPDEDLPRLALADWCMEQPGLAMQARGEFIHARCRAAVMALDDPERTRLEHRAKSLMDQFGIAWLENLEKHLTGWTFDRGLIHIIVDENTFQLQSGFRLFRRAKDALKSLSRIPGWRWVIGIRGKNLQSQDLERLLASDQFSHLSTLDLTDCPIRSDGATVLGTSPRTQHIAALHLGYTQIADIGLRALSLSSHFTNLSILVLSNNGLTRRGIQHLVEGKLLKEIQVLDVSRNSLGDDGIRDLLSSPTIRRLRRLSLAGCDIKDRGGILLVDSPGLEQVSILDLEDNLFSKDCKQTLREHFGSRIRL